MSDTRVVLRQHEIDAMATDPWVADMLLEFGDAVAVDAAARAPKRTGAGAASIHAESVLDGPEITAHIGWSRDQWYMRFPDLGTSRIPAQHFLENALEGFSP
jgi:HK97 gp10 family phage protein